MSKLKILIPILIIVAVLAGGYMYLKDQLVGGGDTLGAADIIQEEADGITWYKDNLKTYSLAIFDKPLVFDFATQNAASLRQQAVVENYVAAINGSFYRGSIVEAKHAGLLQIEGELFQEMVTDSQKQLTHVIVYDQPQDNVELISTADLVVDDFKYAEFTLVQTGPLLIKDGALQTKLMEDSANGKQRTLRTVLGILPDGQKFFFVTRVGMTLVEVAELLKSVGPLQGKNFSAINLDGGSSTAMYSLNLEDFNFGSGKRLPLVIGVK